ncbi:hypothetical protein [Desulfotalea psychrophila]|uniref:Uncharacterized protein n=1 Tax=Desulfotalea psychrophila (strain LSv54 / DSM 12343) TaxID=177439 RepID=Q6ALQ8_DESPS|nr:hypothetical protein [Desulfotalea psychrophila]CAG36717.1 hypothetical protein DP1988 [Desulfotalea psychrophila LSv54]
MYEKELFKKEILNFLKENSTAYLKNQLQLKERVFLTSTIGVTEGGSSEPDGYAVNEDIFQKKTAILADKIFFYEDLFKDFITAYRLFQDLPQEVRISLQPLLNDSSLNTFIMSSAQMPTIENIWNYIKYEIIEEQHREEKNLHLEQIKNIFDLLFSQYVCYDSNYSRLTTKKGEVFDPDIHIRVLSGRVSGRVDRVLFQGYENKKTGLIIKKSIVENI